jgi:hypothetical protein
MSATLTDQLNRSALATVPRSVDGKGRRPTTFDAYNVKVSEFQAARDSGAVLEGERRLQDSEVEAIKKAIDEHKPFQAPAGIPGYDFIDLRGDRLIHFSRPVVLLTSVKFVWHPPMKVGATEDGDTILSAGHWTQQVTMRLLKCLTPRHEVKRLVKQAEANEAARQKPRTPPPVDHARLAAELQALTLRLDAA